MPTIEELKQRIETAEDLKSIVRNMKAVAAVTIRRLEMAVESLAGYNRTIELGLQALLKYGRDVASLPTGKEEGTTAVLVLGSDQGMCGRFNEEIAGFARNRSKEVGIELSRCTLAAAGERVAGALRAAGFTVDPVFSMPKPATNIDPVVRRTLPAVERWRSERGMSRLLVFHNRPAVGAIFEPNMIRLLPLDSRRLAGLRGAEWPSRSIPQHSLDWHSLFSSLVRQYLFVSIFRACAESLASENASRIASMQAAEQNVEDKLEEFSAHYRQERQRGITEELMDIVSGYESLSSSGGS